MTSKFTVLMLVAITGLLAVPLGVAAAENVAELSAMERDQLEAELDATRAELDAAAHKLAELHGRLYAMETIGDPGRKPMLGILIGERGPNGGLMLVGVTPGGGAETAGLQAGDEVTSVNNADLTGAVSAMSVLKAAMKDVASGDTVPLGYRRDGSSALASVTTQAKGVYIMGMTGAPGMHVDMVAFEEMTQGITEQFAEIEFDGEWVESLEALENLESLEELQMLGQMAPQDHAGAIAIGGMGMGMGMALGGPAGGLRLEGISGDMATYFGVESGVLVMNVPSAPDGEALDLKAGDILLVVDGEPIRHPADAYRTLMGGQHAADGGTSTLSVEIMRQGSTQVVQVSPKQLGGGLHNISIRRVGSDEVDVEIMAPPSH